PLCQGPRRGVPRRRVTASESGVTVAVSVVPAGVGVRVQPRVEALQASTGSGAARDVSAYLAGGSGCAARLALGLAVATEWGDIPARRRLHGEERGLVGGAAEPVFDGHRTSPRLRWRVVGGWPGRRDLRDERGVLDRHGGGGVRLRQALGGQADA